MSNKTIANMTVKLGAKTDGFNKGLSGAKSKANSFQSQMKKLGGVIAATFAVGSVIAFGKATVEAADVQMKTEAKLLQALKGRQDVYEALTRQASDLQKQTLFGDEATIEAQAQLAIVLGSNRMAIERLTPLVQDMATALKMDLSSAAQLVAKTLGSSTNSLSRYGIIVEGAVGSNERLESAVSSLSSMFEGQAKKAAETGTGAITQFRNAVGDLKEDIGREIIPALTKFVKSINTLIDKGKDFKKAFKINTAEDRGRSAAEGFINKNAKKESEERKKILEDELVKADELWEKHRQAYLKNQDDIEDSNRKIRNAAKQQKDIIKGHLDYWYSYFAEIRDEIESLSVASADKKIVKVVTQETVVPPAEEIAPLYAPIENASEKLKEFKGTIIDVKGAIKDVVDTSKIGFEEVEVVVSDFAIAMNQMFEHIIEDSIYAFADALGEVLVTGDIEGSFKKILSAFGGFMQQMGMMMVAYGVSVGEFFTAWKDAGVGLVVAGAAMIALGAGIKALANKNPMSSGGATGTNTSSGMMTAKDVMRIHLAGSISGDTIKISNERSTTNQRRVNGLRY